MASWWASWSPPPRAKAGKPHSADADALKIKILLEKITELQTIWCIVYGKSEILA